MGCNTTLVGLKALLAVRDAHQRWSGRDVEQMISSTAAYLINSYDDKGDWAGSPGWHGIGQGPNVTPIDTMTLFSYALLLKASEALPDKIQIPADMMRAMKLRVTGSPGSQHVTGLVSEQLDPFKTDKDGFHTPFVDIDGKEKEGEYTWKYRWYPYAVLFTKGWLDHLQASNSDRTEVVAARRALGRLIPLTQQLPGRGTFYRGETLRGLDQVQ